MSYISIAIMRDDPYYAGWTRVYDMEWHTWWIFPASFTDEQITYSLRRQNEAYEAGVEAGKRPKARENPARARRRRRQRGAGMTHPTPIKTEAAHFLRSPPRSRYLVQWCNAAAESRYVGKDDLVVERRGNLVGFIKGQPSTETSEAQL